MNYDMVFRLTVRMLAAYQRYERLYVTETDKHTLGVWYGRFKEAADILEQEYGIEEIMNQVSFFENWSKVPKREAECK